MYWLRRRLGCAGRERLRIVATLRASVGEVWSAPQRAVGWSAAQTAAFAQAYRLQELARAVRGRGDAESLARIAWWGSALADLAPADVDADGCAQRGEVLGICAAFNLAVALFDTAIDEAPIPRLALVEALAPRRLHSRLYQPDSEATRLRSEHPAAALVVGLFDQALTDIGHRFAGQHARLDALITLLEAMYRSVLGQSDEPFIAKTGPVLFIGRVAAGDQAQRLYFELARFCHIWDDALDVAEDLVTLAPNHFLGTGRGVAMLSTLSYVGRGALRVVAGSAMHGDIERALSMALRATVDAARDWNDESHAKTLSLCHALLS